MVRGLVLTLALVAMSAQQQPTPRYAERVDVTSVLVDVRVLDDRGAPLLGLEQSDFRVSIGGKNARVQSATWVGGRPAPVGVSANAASAHVSDDRPPSGRLIVFLIQRSLLKGYAYGLMRMLEQSRAVVSGLTSDDRVAILSFDTSLKIWTDFTNDSAVLDHILERGVLHESPPPPRGPLAPSFAGRLDSQTARRASTIERAFELVARALEPLPGAKTIAFISHAMGRMNLIGTATSPGYEKARTALIDARAVVFALDFTPADTHGLAFGLQKVASETGGFYAQSLDFPERPMQWLDGAIAGYYVLFVDKPEDSGGKRELSVALTRRQGHTYATATYSNSRQ